MSGLADARGCRLSGATPAALEAYERAAAAFLHWRPGAEPDAEAARRAAPGFKMAHVLAAWMVAAGRDRLGAQRARPIVAHAAALPGDARERGHIAALEALIGDDLDGAKARLADVLRIAPRDALALQMVHALDHLTGDTAAMLDRVEAVLPAWQPAIPGHAAVLAMHAFALVEAGEHGRAEGRAQAALALDPAEPRAHHAMAHVFEMTGRADAGASWMRAHVAAWGSGSAVTTHAWWHLALFELARGDVDAALAIHDAHIRVGRPALLGDLIDSSSLLWRMMLGHGESSALHARFAELGDAWAPRIDDAYCTFSDIHAMIAFVGARQWRRVERLERVMLRSAGRPTRHGATSRLVGLPACRALIAFGRGRHGLVASMLAQLPPQAHRIGGSEAQRDLLLLTQRHAVQHEASRRRIVWAWPGGAAWSAGHS